MRSQFVHNRLRKSSLSTVPPSGVDYSSSLEDVAASVLYRSPLPSHNDLPIYILNGAALPDLETVDYDALLPYVLARFPDDEALIGSRGYEIVFFAGGGEHSPSSPKKGRPGWTWFLQAYNILSRAMRKRLQKLYLVHERRWIRMTMEMFSTIASPKFRKKIVHASTLSALALHIPIEDLLMPPSAYLYDRRRAPDIHVPYATGRRAFGAQIPLPISSAGRPRLPRVLREATSFVLNDQNIQTKGIFRVNARAVTLGILKEAYDRGQKFIVWKEGQSLLTFCHWKEGHGNVLVEELRYMEGFDLNAAAGLVKLWYAELREPIFPQTSYAFVEKAFGNPEIPIEASAILDLIAEASDWSPIPRASRLILIMHLLPLLSVVAQAKDWNQMTSYNLGVCFAPLLFCGPDPVEDAKLAAVIRRILEFSIEQWHLGLSTACGMDRLKFEESLRVPESVEDREDPLESTKTSFSGHTMQSNGIVLIDAEDSDDEDQDDRPPLPPRHILTESNGDSGCDRDEGRPPLPPRLNAISGPDDSFSGASVVKRKPAPLLPTLPRYSTIITQSPTASEGLPLYTVAGISRLSIPHEPGQSSENVANSNLDTTVHRKPTSTAATKSRHI